MFGGHEFPPKVQMSTEGCQSVWLPPQTGALQQKSPTSISPCTPFPFLPLSAKISSSSRCLKRSKGCKASTSRSKFRRRCPARQARASLRFEDSPKKNTASETKQTLPFGFSTPGKKENSSSSDRFPLKPTGGNRTYA